MASDTIQVAQPIASTEKDLGDSYAGPRSDNEYSRLRLQHDFIKYAMEGELILAPVDLSKPKLRVLDSATGDGFWLVDLAPLLKPDAQMIGADIAPQHFIPKEELPMNVSLIQHDIFQPWPAELQQSFDLVHQRFVLMACNDTNSVQAIQNLYGCVKPGGWMQFHDGDMATIEEGPGHEAMEKFRAIARTGWTMMGFNLSPGPKLVDWLKDVGLEDIEERVLSIKCGKSSPHAEQGEKVIQMLTASLDNMLALATNMPGFPYKPEEIQQLKIDLPEELRRVGNSYRTHVVWARRPL